MPANLGSVYANLSSIIRIPPTLPVIPSSSTLAIVLHFLMQAHVRRSESDTVYLRIAGSTAPALSVGAGVSPKGRQVPGGPLQAVSGKETGQYPHTAMTRKGMRAE